MHPENSWGNVFTYRNDHCFDPSFGVFQSEITLTMIVRLVKDGAVHSREREGEGGRGRGGEREWGGDYR